MAGPFDLDARQVNRITAFLFHRGDHDDPAALKANHAKSFKGAFVFGMGFTFDDTDTKGVASAIATMRELIAKDPKNSERIFPYIGGEEVNDNPTHAHHRYVINFGQMTEDEARRWPDLMDIVEQKVKPHRLRQNRETRARYWWRFGEVAPGLYQAIRSLDRVLVVSSHGDCFAFAFMDARVVFSHALIVIASGSKALFCALQSRLHESWARLLGSSIKDDLRYTPSDCFETFPFPDLTESLARAGHTYYEWRADLMVRTNQGLTATCNRFHDRHDRGGDIVKLRVLHDVMDRAVLDAYGWSDIVTDCEFIPEHDDESEGEAEGAGSRKKIRYRYRWPDKVRDEVLARLLELNRQRAEEERLLAVEVEKAPGKPRGKRSKKPSPEGGPSVLF